MLRSRSSSPAAAEGRRENRGPLSHSFDEAGDVARGLEPVGQLDIRSTPPLARLGALHARGGPDHDHPVDLQFPGRGNVQHDTRAQGVSKKVAPSPTELRPDGVGDECRRAREIGADRVGSGVARQVRADERAVRFQPSAEGAPQPPGLGEPVEHHEGRARPAHLDVKWHDA